MASPHVQIASQSHESRKLNLVSLEKSSDFSREIKNYAMAIKEKTEESYTKEENSGVEYAENKIENNIHSTSYYGTRKVNQIGKQNTRRIKENYNKRKTANKRSKK